MQFILGDFGAGKTSHIKQEVLSLLQQQKQVLLIVPSRRHKDQLLLELLKTQQSVVGTPVLTLIEFQRQLSQHLFSDTSLTNFEKFLVISSICTENSDKFKSFKNIKNRPELLKMVYRLIQSLRDKDIEALQSTPELQDKIHDIQLILTEYHQSLTTRTDSKQEIDLICQSPLPPQLLPDNVYVDGFVDFTATQFKLIQHIATQLEKQNKHITITLTDTPHTISEQTIQHFQQAFPHAKTIPLSSKSSLANAFLLDSDYSQQNLEFYEIQAFGKTKEIEYVVNQIKKLCITQDYSLDDILVVTNRQDQYTPILMSALRKSKIPFAFGKDDKLSQNPLILFIKRSLKLMTETLNHESLEFLAQSNYVKEEHKLLWNKALTLIPFAIDGRQQAWELAFQQLDPNEADDLEAIRTSIMHLCQKFVDPYKKHPIDEIVQYLVELIDFFGIQEELTKSTPLVKHKKIIEMSIAKDYSALLKLKEIILELQKSLDGEISMYNFLFFFNIITDETRYRSEIPQKNVLRILTPNDTRGLFVKTVFVLGLNEGEFPSSPNLELFDNFDRSQLNTLTKKILGQSLWDTDVDYFNEQKLAFATVLSRATEKIFFSRTPVNEKGVYFNCSHFLQRILSKNITYIRIPHTDSTDKKNPTIFQKKHNPDEYFELTLLTQNSTQAQKAYEYTQNIALANDTFDKGQLPETSLCEYFGYIPSVSHVTKKYTDPTIYVTPTRLERLGRCRYQGLWQDFWKLKSYSLPSYKPEAADYGNLYHEVLEKYIPQNNEFDSTLLHKILQDCIDNSSQMYLFTLDYHFLYLTLSNFLQNTQSRLPHETKFVELSSGEGELSHNIVALTPQQSLTVYSRIDRVDYDKSNNSYSVIDYKKSGIDAYKEYQSTPFNLFQGFLYSELLRNNNKAPIQSVSYIFLEKDDTFEEFPNTNSKKSSYQSIHEFQNFKLTEINRLVTLLGEGNFSPFTFESDIGATVKQLFEDKFGDKFSVEYHSKCVYCDLQDLCPRRQKLKKTQSY